VIGPGGGGDSRFPRSALGGSKSLEVLSPRPADKGGGGRFVEDLKARRKRVLYRRERKKRFTGDAGD